MPALHSVHGHVDRYCILDTGSTDGTLAIVRHWLQTHLYPDQYELHEEPFVDFATTRNRLLQLAGQHTEFLLTMNGDDTLVMAMQR